MHLKLLAPVLACALIITMVASGCVMQYSGERREYEYPEKYTDSMNEVRDRVVRLEQLIDRRQYRQAERQAFILDNLTKKLHEQIPPRALDEVERIDGYQVADYHAQVDDLHRSATWLVYFVRQQSHADALNHVDEYISRYNRLSLNFGPAVSAEDTIPAPDRSAEDFRVSDDYKDVNPGERLLHEGSRN